MSDNQTHNGWRNSDTWRVQLHIANDEAAARTVSGIAFLYVTRFRMSYVPGSHYPETFAQWLREFVEERCGGLEVGGTAFEMLARDFVEAALSRVDWDQLANHWLNVGRDDAKQRGIAVADEVVS